jgi:hypothetical protein
MNTDYKNFFKYNAQNLLFLVIILVVIIIIIYASIQTSLQQNNCTKIAKKFPAKTYQIYPFLVDDTITLTQLHIKTAYNCCCSGKFKNDYVDTCALLNCAKYGVRALDFQIYKLNGKPIISASTVNEIKYKEIYNYLDFNSTMLQVRKTFIDSPNVTNNNGEPLFLIFRVYSTSKDTYNLMFDSLNNIFGSGLSESINNIIFFTSDLTTATFNQLMGKVIILVECCKNSTYDLECETVFNTSSLYNITSLTLSGSGSRIYRESELIWNNPLDYVTFKSNNINNLNIIYPNLQTNYHNYDFITSGINNGITFIGLNFQNNDSQLTRLNTFDDPTTIPITYNGFGGNAFKLKNIINTNTDISDLFKDFQENVLTGNGLIQDMITRTSAPIT